MVTLVTLQSPDFQGAQQDLPAFPEQVSRKNQTEQRLWSEVFLLSGVIAPDLYHTAEYTEDSIHRNSSTWKCSARTCRAREFFLQGLNPVQRFNNTLRNAVWSTGIQVHRFNNHWHRSAALSLFYFTEGTSHWILSPWKGSIPVPAGKYLFNNLATSDTWPLHVRISSESVSKEKLRELQGLTEII